MIGNRLFNKKRITYLWLAFIILFSLTITFSIRVSSNPIQSLISYDPIPNLIQSERFIADHNVSQINFNSWYLKWMYNPKPIGFPILAAEYSMMGDAPLYSVGYFSLIYYFLEILLVFMLSYKIFKNKKIALFSSFLMATYLTGPSNQGPLYAHYANLDFIFFFSMLIALISFKNMPIKIIVSSIFLAGIMVTHRPGLIFVFLFATFLIIYSVVYFLIKKSINLLKNITVPYLASFVFGWDIAYIYWSHVKLENILLFGYPASSITLGGFPKFFEKILQAVTPEIYLGVLLIINILAVFFVVYISRRRGIQIIDTSNAKINTVTFFALSIILPVLFFVSLIYLGNMAGIKFTGNPFKYFINLWLYFATEAYTSQTANIIKQTFYLWHWNIITMIFLLASFYVIFKNIKSNVHTALFAGAVAFMLPIMITTQIYMSYTTVGERLYLYLAPFVYLIVSFSIVKFLSLPHRKNIKRSFIAILLALIIINSGLFISYSTTYKSPAYSDKEIEVFTYLKVSISSKYIISSGENAYGNLYDSLRYKNIYPWWGQIPPNKLLNIARTHNIDYLYMNKDPQYLPLPAKSEYLDLDNYCWKIYSTDMRNVYYVW